MVSPVLQLSTDMQLSDYPWMHCTPNINRINNILQRDVITVKHSIFYFRLMHTEPGLCVFTQYVRVCVCVCLPFAKCSHIHHASRFVNSVSKLGADCCFRYGKLFYSPLQVEISIRPELSDDVEGAEH